MLIELGNIDVQLLQEQTALAALLSADGYRRYGMSHRQMALMEGIWNLLGHIRDQVDPSRDDDEDDEPTLREKAEDIAEAARQDDELALDKVQAALCVIVFTPKSRAWLQANDPMALRQALNALAEVNGLFPIDEPKGGGPRSEAP